MCFISVITLLDENSFKFQVSGFKFRNHGRLFPLQEEITMATFHSFEEIECWRKARELTRQVYLITGMDSFAKDFGLKDQIRRASVSVMSNIAEGYDRSGTAEFIRFLTIAKGSAAEVRCQLYVALDQGYVNERMFSEIRSLATETARLTAGLIKYLKGSGYKGTRFK
jgi:four helix bundle protein